MSDKSHISWCDATWPVTTGCSIVSTGCANCFALRLSATRMKHLKAYEGVAEMRQRANGTRYPVWTGKVHLAYDRLDWPRRWQRPRRIFVDSMSDLFWESVPFEFIDKVFDVMEEERRHIYQVLTKRPKRMRLYMEKRVEDHWHVVNGSYGNTFYAEQYIQDFPHIWLGTSVENQDAADERILDLMHAPAAVRFLSCEPLLGPIDLTRIDVGGGYVDCLRADYHDGKGNVIAGPPAGSGPVRWVIAGGESGPNHRPMDVDWARGLRDQAGRAGVAFWYKQGSGHTNEMHPYLDGFKYKAFPGRPLGQQLPAPYGSCEGEDIQQAFQGETAYV